MQRSLSTGVAAALAVVLCAFWPFGATAKPKGPKVVKVDCGKGQSVQEALDGDAAELVVEITGVCAEYVLVTRDNVALRGVGGATIDGTNLPTPKQDGITLLGASNATFENLTVQGMRRGVSLDGGAGARLTGVVLQDNNEGLYVNASSSATVTDCTLQRNARWGLSAWNASSVVLNGSITSSLNGRGGLVISGSSLAQLTGSTFEANENGSYGILLQMGASALLAGPSRSVTTDRNRNYGVWIIENSSIAVGQLSSTGNGIGLAVESAHLEVSSATVAGNMLTDLDLSFGARADSYGTMTVGRIMCDPTVLTRGIVACPASPAPAPATMQARPHNTERRPGGVFRLNEGVERETAGP